MTKALQTRQQHYDLEVEKQKDLIAANAKLPARLRKPVPVPEIIRPGDVVGKDGAGRDMAALPSDVNSTDVRYFDPESGLATPWVRVADQSELDLEWNLLNAEG